MQTRRSSSRRLAVAALVGLLALVGAVDARADGAPFDPPRDPESRGIESLSPGANGAPEVPGRVELWPADVWRARFEEARTHLLQRRYAEARVEFEVLARTAPTPSERMLADEMARLAASYASIAVAPPARHVEAPVRTTDELTLLYATSFLYGVGTGSWFLLQTQPDSALTATLPFAVATAAPVIAVATVDGYKKFRRGVPQSIAAGVFLGFGQGIWISGLQHARATRIEEQNPSSRVRWSAEGVSSALWGGATLGAAMGATLGSTLVTTPGRVSFTTSTTIWAGTLSGLGAGALFPADRYRQERAFAAGGIGYNAGLATGLLLAGRVSPSVARVRLADLSALLGGLATGGVYLSLTRDVDRRTAEGLTAIGAGAGLAAGWLLTSGMARETPPSAPPPVSVQPSLQPVVGGATLGIVGAM